MSFGVQVVFDCAEPSLLSEFWAAALGYIVQPPPEGFQTWEAFLAEIGVPEELWGSRSAVVDPDDTGLRIYFQRVPEPKTTKNRVHLDVRTSGGPGVDADERRLSIDGKAEELLGRGATRLRATEEMGEYWVVLQDPEGKVLRDLSRRTVA